LRTEWGKKNPDKQRALYRARDKRKLERDPEAYRAAAAERVARYRELHPDRIAEDSARNNAERIAKWRSLHPGREAELKGHRLMVERKRLPWADVPRMKDMYELARAYRSAGVSCQVDHIVPLKHPLVCGLHVIWNLQLLSRKDNSSKGNRTWPDMPDG
jgi:5-methylcytosine-specific restriction endonuclease McrA